MKKFGTQKPSLRFKSLLLSLFLTLNSGVTEFAQAGGCSHSHGCEADLLESCGGENRNMIIFGSGQNTREMPEIRRAAQIAYDVSRSLGLSIPPTIIRFMNASEMAALSSTAGHPAPHFHDGSQIISSSSRAGGILEFVTPGTTSHQFVRDTNTLHDTILVFAHVGGHYDFGENTRYFVSRSPDQMKYSYELATYMAQLYTEYDHDEVAEFYQRLLSLEYLQDLTRGGFEAPESFQVDRSRPDRQQIPQTTTQSILQAFISHLPSSEPRWKHELARLFERLHRVLPAYIQTKTMNEGWATFMEYMILSHTEWKTTDDELRFGILNSGVRSPGLSNPYWLGTEGWMRIWNRFKERPEVRDLPALEQDRRFIAEAHHIIATHNDFEFIRMAFDEKWVRDHHLYLKRPISRTERGRPYNYQHNRLVVTRDPKRIVN